MIVVTMDCAAVADRRPRPIGEDPVLFAERDPWNVVSGGPRLVLLLAA